MVFQALERRVPTGVQTAELLLRPLRVDDVELDYQAVLESREQLRRWEQGDWPADGFTLADNRRDLERHQAEHQRGVAYTYTVMSRDQARCLGCVYVKPLRQVLEWLAADPGLIAASTGQQACVSFWVRSCELENGLEARLLELLRGWLLRDWSFERVLYSSNTAHAHQLDLMRRSGLRPWQRLSAAAGGEVEWVLFEDGGRVPEQA